MATNRILYVGIKTVLEIGNVRVVHPEYAENRVLADGFPNITMPLKEWEAIIYKQFDEFIKLVTLANPNLSKNIDISFPIDIEFRDYDQRFYQEGDLKGDPSLKWEIWFDPETVEIELERPDPFSVEWNMFLVWVGILRDYITTVKKLANIR